MYVHKQRCYYKLKVSKHIGQQFILQQVINYLAWQNRFSSFNFDGNLMLLNISVLLFYHTLIHTHTNIIEYYANPYDYYVYVCKLTKVCAYCIIYLLYDYPLLTFGFKGVIIIFYIVAKFLVCLYMFVCLKGPPVHIGTDSSFF